MTELERKLNGNVEPSQDTAVPPRLCRAALTTATLSCTIHITASLEAGANGAEFYRNQAVACEFSDGDDEQILAAAKQRIDELAAEVLIRWASDPATIVETVERGPLSIRGIVDFPPYMGAATYLVKKFAAVRDEIAAADEAKAAAAKKREARLHAIVDKLASKAGFASGDAMAEQDPAEHQEFSKVTAEFIWGEKELLLDLETVGVAQAAGAIWNKILVHKYKGRTAPKPAPLPAPTPAAKSSAPAELAIQATEATAAGAMGDAAVVSAALHRGDRDDLVAGEGGDLVAGNAGEPQAKMSDAEMEKAVLRFLKADQEPHTYNQIMCEMGLTYPEAWIDVSRAAHALAKHKKAQIVCYNVPRPVVKADKDGKPAKSVKPGKPGKAEKTGESEKTQNVKLFKYAPWRAKIDRDPMQTQPEVQRVLLAVVTSTPAISWNAIRDDMRHAFVHLSSEIIDKARAELLASHAIIDAKGPRGARLHYAKTGEGAKSYAEESARRGWDIAV